MVLLIQTILFFLILGGTYIVFKKWNAERQIGRRYPPSLPSLPLVGSLPFLRNLNNIAVFLMEKSYELGPIFTIRAGSKFMLILSTKETIEEALLKNSRAFSSRQEMNIEILGNRNRKGIAFTVNSPNRKRIHQVSLSILKEFGFGVKNIMEEMILLEAEAVSEYLRKTRGGDFDPRDLCYQISSNVMINFFFGYRREYSIGVSEFTKRLDRFASLLDLLYDIAPFLRYIPPFNKKISEMLVWSKDMYELIDREVEETLKKRKNSCFVQRYVEKEGPNYDKEELNYVLRDIVSGGNNTTASLLQWALVVLANNPDVQERFYKEIESTLQKGDLPTLQDEAMLPYAEATMLELHRWVTLLPLSLLRTTSCDAVLSGYFVPANTTDDVHASVKFWLALKLFSL